MPFTNDAIVFGILMISLGFVFYTESKKSGFWYKFYKVIHLQKVLLLKLVLATMLKLKALPEALLYL